MQVKYLDSLELKDINVSSEGTHVSVWTNALVKKAIKQDRGSNGLFGMAPVMSFVLVFSYFLRTIFIFGSSHLFSVFALC
jgi:hypothetical protein